MAASRLSKRGVAVLETPSPPADFSHGICQDCLEKHYPLEYAAMSAENGNSTEWLVGKSDTGPSSG